MDQSTRTTLRNVVTQCRRLLEESVAQVLQGQFGIYAAGQKDEVQIEPEARMSHLSEEDQAYRQDLLDHYEHIKALGYKANDALAQLIREVAFTHLNRFCAYRMMESRGLIRESVSKGLKSQGFLFYLADHEEDERRFSTGKQDIAYRHFLNWLGGTLSEEIGVLFAPTDPANRLYPPQRVTDQVLGLINDPDLAGIWSEDEAIGWVYQYFTPKELRDQARKESQAPRNSYELAFRNQFFTPRYVVEFLTDNTLGRIWYEMRQGDTRLKDQCRYMVRRPTEVFLKNGEAEPNDAAKADDDLSQEELLKLPVYVLFRAKKDPRELRILDPACGSGHFLLYCFDLLLTIYEEAYGDQTLGPALKKDYPTLEGLRRDVPRLILAHNLHGIDIDPRASQIAALALWLRCQRAYQEMGINQDRPKITRSNIVCAEPMPGEEAMLKEFVAQLEPKVLGQVVEVVFEKMKLAGEAGSLLKIEEEIRDAVAAAKKQYAKQTTHAIDRKGRAMLFSEAEMGRLVDGPRQASLFDVSDITDARFFEQAEKRVAEALRTYAETAQSGQRLSRSLFAEDAVRGFAFIDACQTRYDVVLMNPPFGDLCVGSKRYVETSLPESKGNILAHFVQRACDLLSGDGMVGAIVSRTCFYLTSLEPFRTSVLGSHLHVDLFADLGSKVLDAVVETAAFVGRRRVCGDQQALFFRFLASNTKDSDLLQGIENANKAGVSDNAFQITPSDFRLLSGAPYVYWISGAMIRQLAAFPTLEQTGGEIRVGLQTGDDFRFLRLWFEVGPGQIAGVDAPTAVPDIPDVCLRATDCDRPWAWYTKIDAASPFAASIHLVVNWGSRGKAIKDTHVARGDAISRYVRSEAFYFLPGISYMLRSSRLVPYAVPPGAIPTAGRSQIYPHTGSEEWVLALAASNVASAVARFRGENFGQPKFQNTMVGSVPFAHASPDLLGKVSSTLKDIGDSQRSRFRECETCIEFEMPAFRWTTPPITALDRRSLLGRPLDDAVAQLFGFGKGDIPLLERDMLDSVLSAGCCSDEDDDDASTDEADKLATSETKQDWAHSVLSYAVGVCFGRWDARRAKSLGAAQPKSNLFTPLPSLPPGFLVTTRGSPCNHSPPEYPCDVRWEGILVCAPEHDDDIVRHVQRVMAYLDPADADAIESDCVGGVGAKDLHEYFRKPGKGGFWGTHIARYTRSRRKAPIYWLLQSSKKNYAIWLYYHRLDKDILFKALVNYVEPKIRLENDRLESLRSQKGEGGTSKASKKLDKEIEKQEDFLSELRDFEEKLRRAAELRLVPDLNDGVVLNIAPLHELVPWKEAKNYWEELVEGKYEWSSIGKQLREKGLVT